MNDNNNMVDYKDVVYKIIGAAMEVHNVLGFGLLEPVYQEALALELNSRGIQCDREVEISTYYKGQLMSKNTRWICLLTM
jgi:GxxExxY protein